MRRKPTAARLLGRRALGRRALGLALAVALGTACENAPKSVAEGLAASAPSAPPEPAPKKVEVEEKSMGTRVTFVAFTSRDRDEATTRALIGKAFAEIERLAKLLSDWTEDSDVAAINRGAGSFVEVAPTTVEVIERGLWAGRVSSGTFDITWNALGDLWKFGDAEAEAPTPPAARAVKDRLKLVDWSKVEVREGKIRIPRSAKIGLGGIAKGYIVDRAAMTLRKAGLAAFLVQAGGDLYGHGKKPDGAAWVSGVQDPRAPAGTFFASIELENHAFSTAGDYARSYIHEGRRYHHIIDPRTGWPATECRSVTVWAPDAFTADTVDDAVFILGPEKGLALVETLEGVGALIVDGKNRVTVSKRLEGRVHVLRAPTDGI